MSRHLPAIVKFKALDNINLSINTKTADLSSNSSTFPIIHSPGTKKYVNSQIFKNFERESELCIPYLKIQTQTADMNNSACPESPLARETSIANLNDRQSNRGTIQQIKKEVNGKLQKNRHGIMPLDINLILSQDELRQHVPRTKINENRILETSIKSLTPTRVINDRTINQSARIQNASRHNAPLRSNRIVEKTATNQNSSLNSNQENVRIFALTGNEVNSISLGYYNPYMKYCNKNELDRQVQADQKSQTYKNKHIFSQNYNAVKGLALKDYKTDHYLPISTRVNNFQQGLDSSRYSSQRPQKRNMRLNDFSTDHLKENSKTDLLDETSLLLDRSKFNIDLSTERIRIKPPLEVNHSFDPNSTNYEAINSTFDRQFKKLELVRNNREDVMSLYKTRQPNTQRTQNSNKLNLLKPVAVSERTVSHLNDLAMKKSDKERHEELKKMSKYIEGEIAAQSNRVEDLIVKFAQEFEIPDS